MTRFSAQIAVLLAMAGVTTAAGCELIVGGHHVPGTGGGSTTTTSASSSSGTGGATGGSGGKSTSTGGSGGATGGTGGMSTGGTGGMATGGTGGMGTGGSGPTCTTMTCAAPSDCPKPSGECVVATCDMGCCGTTNVADLTPTVNGQTPADCQLVVCDGAGATKNVPDDMDSFDDGNDCTIDACSGGSVTNLPKAAGAACATNGTFCDGNSKCVECLQNTDCAATTNFCSAQNTCVAATCGDMAKNGNETDVDCGGGCSTCANGKLCVVAADCTNGVCSGTPATCQAALCTDVVKNGTETDVDCGGSCATKCGPGLGCTVDADCIGGSCSGTTCLPTCTDGVKNAAESDIDCGGASCTKCGTNKDCTAASDCASNVCTGNKCQAPTCTDNTKNANETGTDCGGSACPTCPAGQGCAVAGDCASQVCLGTPKLCQAPSCSDLVKNGTESDIDCGGTCATKCGTGKVCGSGADCASNVCTGGLCVAAACGDGVKSVGEGCDDGNKIAGDGCSAICFTEFGFTCTGTPSVCTTTCGDGFKASTEGCDDHNTINGDGCSSTCTVQPGYTCTGSAPSVCTTTCGDSVVVGAETCDDGNATNGDGCSATCAPEAGWTCTGQGAGSCTPVCGNSVLHGGESCDDGNTTAGDGCDAGCHQEPGWTCTGVGTGSCKPTCGDGARVGGEPCDDGNTNSNDGCSATCAVELGFTCNGVGAGSCTSSCGDGTKASDEACDDGNASNTDGCAACVVQPGYTCTGTQPSVCVTSCGDGVRAGSETCDDGNAVSNDGCSSACTVEFGFTCSGQGAGSCTSSCGDGKKASNEACDDFNNTNGDGCTAGCTVEPGYTCIGTQPSVCSAGCGDGIHAGTEGCDDGNNIDGDGCSASCNAEPGYTCPGQGPGSCVTTCGDGVLAGLEQCDDTNLNNNDGCSSGCIQEPGWVCTGQGAGSCVATCGDGLMVGTEGCDDGNLANSDGCSSLCVVEQFWACTGVMPSVCNGICGDGQIKGTETCDDSNTTNGDGCSSACLCEAGFECEPNNACGATVNPMLPFSGSPKTTAVKGNIVPAADLDFYSFTLAGPGLSTVRIETYFGTVGTCASTDANDTRIELRASTDCTSVLASNDDSIGYCSVIDGTSTTAAKNLAPGTYTVRVQASPLQSTPTPLVGYGMQVKILTVCGGNTLETGEGCDDGNNVAGDGCSPTCTVETGYTCTGAIGSPSVCTKNCGNGTLQSGETCDDNNPNNGDGCSSTCTVEPGYTCAGTPSVCVFSCGNGIVTGSEKCDDGNLISGDGCNALCQFEFTPETEANGTCATANGPFTIPPGTAGRLISGSLTPPGTTTGDQDWFAFTVPAYADLSAQTFDVNGPSTCATIDTQIELWNNCAGVVLATNDQGGVGAGGCSLIEASTAAARHVAPGTYYVHVNGFGSTAYNYSLQVKFTALCGNNIVEGSEECDGTPGCNADCTLTVACGNGKLQAGEGCDDGNLNNGDGCSSTCTVETGFACVGVQPNVCAPICGDNLITAPETCDGGNTASGDGCDASCRAEISIAEIEGNDTVATADTNATNSGIIANGASTMFAGAITPAGDKDIYKVNVAQTGVVRFETFDTSGNDCTAANIAAAMKLTIVGTTACTVANQATACAGIGPTATCNATSLTCQINTDTTSGIGNCSALVLNMSAGTYYAIVERNVSGVIAAYKLQVSVQTDRGNESERNEANATADALPGSNVYIFGGHQVNADFDTFAVNVPAGKSIRAEIIEGSTAETCESNGIDSRLRLFNSAGTELGTSDDDTGRGFCSLIDGTGTSGGYTAARALAAGIYYLRVEASSPTGITLAGQFDYRLVVTVR